MSTPALIIVKVNPNDIGKVRKCDTTKIHLRTYEDVEKKVKYFYPELKDDELKKRIDLAVEFDMIISPEDLAKRIRGIKLPNYLCIYHHMDGYPDRLGEELKKNYSTYEEAINLALAGGFSTIMDGATPYMRNPRAIWKNNKPYKWDTIEGKERVSYNYLFENGKWHICEFHGKEFVDF